eukprot:CAMPEP_0181414868 /NCGR_PEP_ID=MMETSP1110-20121109/9725_1 /TAXON_ID=174948 /ORGANISM="Symbiodinium sp., Strain CCMP421" /LENGTH=105 /DNA_ID=CAMNT_0023537757 /DNA_START=95 /DNA_END=411 /DNA_ORIENTATION=+
MALIAIPATSRCSTALQHSGPYIMARLATKPLLMAKMLQRTILPASEPPEASLWGTLAQHEEWDEGKTQEHQDPQPGWAHHSAHWRGDAAPQHVAHLEASNQLLP